MAKRGDRVGAVLSKKDGVMELFGYGVYEGDFVPETDDVKAFGIIVLKEAEIKNPRIKLDNGELVWGCECWWGSEDKVKKMESECTIVNIISPSEFRKQYN